VGYAGPRRLRGKEEINQTSYQEACHWAKWYAKF